MMDGGIAKTGYGTGYEMSNLPATSRIDAASRPHFAFNVWRQVVRKDYSALVRRRVDSYPIDIRHIPTVE